MWTLCRRKYYAKAAPEVRELGLRPLDSRNWDYSVPKLKRWAWAHSVDLRRALKQLELPACPKSTGSQLNTPFFGQHFSPSVSGSQEGTVFDYGFRGKL
jgi:hypothetical protein